MNIPNAYEDVRFDPSVDEDTGFKHKTILCMAIKNSSGQIIGVIQVTFLSYFILYSHIIVIIFNYIFYSSRLSY